ncbi:MAG TPA: MlaD family protein [Gemmatimonadaceae bacterium]|nr:MlaD family protein [Gemmatimonadaceae bacterium]
MPRDIRWSELKTGTIAFVVLVATVLSILLFARVGALRGETGTVYVVTDRATGVLGGTEVWLFGEQIGLVKKVHFRPVTSDTTQRLAIETEILAHRLPLIRRDSYVDIRPGGNLIGSPVIYFGSGSAGAPAIRSGDTLVSRPWGVIDATGAQVDRLGAQLTKLADSSKRLMSLLNSSGSTIGAFRQSGMPRISNTNAAVTQLMARSEQGSLRRIMGIEFQTRLTRVLSTKDSIAALLSSSGGNVGRFRKDSTLFKVVAGIRADVDTLTGVLSNSTGTMARARSDSALTRELARIRVELSALMADIKKNPTRYLSP